MDLSDLKDKCRSEVANKFIFSPNLHNLMIDVNNNKGVSVTDTEYVTLSRKG